MSFGLPPDLSDIRVTVDSNRLPQVMANLLSNAAKFFPEHGVMAVSMAQVGARVRVTVTDLGPGVSEEFRERVFRKFAQADSFDTRQKGGTGLGLNICKAIVERFGGTIGLDPALGGSSTFYFDLPIEFGRVGAPPPAVGVRSRVLVCEDDPDAAVLERMLTGAGHEVDIVSGAVQALERLAR